jgi:HSP20 family protein
LPKSPSPVLQKNNFSDNFERSESDSYPQSRDATNTESVEDEDLMLAIDGYRENNFIIIQAFVAGTSIEDISVTLTCKTVMITGERNKIESEKISDENFSLQELCWGKFSRTIELPEEIDIEQAEVTEHHGLLSIRLPIINKNRSRSIKIKKALKLN